jgi:hypothetical protein
VTAVLVVAVILATRACFCELVMAARLGLTVMPTFPGFEVTVIAAGAFLAVSVMDVAIKVTAGFGGTPLGLV